MSTLHSCKISDFPVKIAESDIFQPGTGNDEMLRLTESVTQQGIKSAMVEMHSSVPCSAGKLWDPHGSTAFESLDLNRYITPQI